MTELKKNNAKRLELVKELLEQYEAERKTLICERRVTFEYIMHDRYERYLKNERLSHIGIMPNRWYSCAHIINCIDIRVKQLDIIIKDLKNEIGSTSDVKYRDLKERLRVQELTFQQYRKIYEKLSRLDMQFKKTCIKNPDIAELLGVTIGEIHEARYFINKLRPHLKKIGDEVTQIEEDIEAFKAEQFALGNIKMPRSCFDSYDICENLYDLESQQDTNIHWCVDHVMNGSLFHLL